MAELTEKEISKLKVSDLRNELKSRGLATTGNKNELVERLLESLNTSTGAGSNESGDELDEDVLNDDELEDDLKSIKSVDLDEMSVAKTKPTKKPKLSRTVESEDAEAKASSVGEAAAASAAPQKVVLKRTSKDTEPAKNGDEVKESEDVKEKKIIKLSELTPQERLEMRAKKFGASGSSSGADPKAARAQRFGLAASETKTESATETSNAASVDTLKKRAERFGVTVSTELTKLQNQEMLEKRKERFGGANNGSMSYGDKAKMRLERFKNDPK